jgi:hypothetical protein
MLHLSILYLWVSSSLEYFLSLSLSFVSDCFRVHGSYSEQTEVILGRNTTNMILCSTLWGTQSPQWWYSCWPRAMLLSVRFLHSELSSSPSISISWEGISRLYSILLFIKSPLTLRISFFYIYHYGSCQMMFLLSVIP